MRAQKKRGRRKRWKFFKLILYIILIIFIFRQGSQFLSGIFSYEEYINHTEHDNYNLDDESYDLLKTLANDDKRIIKIIENHEDYPEELLYMLSRNIDMLDFVLEYPDKKGMLYSEMLKSEEIKSIPLLLQYDQRWGYAPYGNKALAISGCGPTSLSMVAAGLTSNKKITPYEVALYAEKAGYYLNGIGSSWELFTEGARKFGIRGEELPLHKNLIFQNIQAGKPIICSMKPGDFTTSGHFIVLYGIEDGKLKIHDSNSKKRSTELWEYERIEGQISNLWTFSID